MWFQIWSCKTPKSGPNETSVHHRVVRFGTSSLEIPNRLPKLVPVLEILQGYQTLAVGGQMNLCPPMVLQKLKSTPKSAHKISTDPEICLQNWIGISCRNLPTKLD